ncbi:MAG: DUF4469 domain-containing protein, partial [Lentimicrobiaceae bacterium]|nr:DUF4469 domain-containing protein [Lentimicrobiaceae bacterium]
MATKEKNSVVVELHDLTLTEQKDDRFGRVVTSKSLNEDDLVNLALARGTDLSATTLKSSVELLKKVAIDQISNGASVKFGLGYFHLTVNGTFIGDNATWDPTQHSLAVNAIPTAELREAVKQTSVNVRGMAASGLFVNSVTDVTTGAVNSRLSPGGGVNLSGSRIKIEGTDPAIGIHLINQQTSEVITIPQTSLLINDPSKLTFIVPATLPDGDYKLNIAT